MMRVGESVKNAQKPPDVISECSLMGRSPPLTISYYVPENQVINFTPIHDLVVKVVMAGYYILPKEW